MLRPMMDAVRAHPVAAAAAVVAGGVALSRAGRRSAAAPEKAAKKTPPARAARKAAPRKRAAGASGGAPRGGLAARVTPDPVLAAVIGADPLTRAEITKRMWAYIREHGLQDSGNRRMINADARLRPIFGAEQVSMFEMTRLVNTHVRAGG